MLEEISIFIIDNKDAPGILLLLLFLTFILVSNVFLSSDGGGMISIILIMALVVGYTTANVKVVDESTHMPLLVLNQDHTVSVYTYRPVKSKDRDLDGSIVEDLQRTSYLIRCSSKGKKVTLRDCWKRVKGKSEAELISMAELEGAPQIVSRR